MANIQKTFSFVNGQPADATQVNQNFDDLLAGINADVSATDKVLGRATAGAGPVEEIPCTAAGRALIDDASATVQIATLGLDADIATLALPANTTISAAGAELINDADAAAQRTTLGAVATGDARLSDARVASDVSAWAKAGTKPTYTYAEVGAPSTSDARLSDARVASDVSAWAKAASNVAIPGAFGCNGQTAQTVYYTNVADLIPFTVGTYGCDTALHMNLLYNMVIKIHAALIANGIMT